MTFFVTSIPQPAMAAISVAWPVRTRIASAWPRLPVLATGIGAYLSAAAEGRRPAVNARSR